MFASHAILFSAGSPSAPPTNLVTNGDFATGDLTGWINTSSHWSNVSNKAFHPNTTSFLMLLTSGIPAVGTSARIRFTISGINAGGRIRVTFRDSGEGNVNGPLWGANQTNDVISSDGSYDITVTVPTGSVYLAFARDNVGFSTQFSLDDVIVNAL